MLLDALSKRCPQIRARGDLTKFYSMFTNFFKELERFHTCPSVATPQHGEKWNHQPCGNVVTYTE